MDILTERISEFANYHPLVQLLPSYVEDTTHLLNILKEIDVLPTNAILVTLSRFFSVHKPVSYTHLTLPTNREV